jgi:hypothetical protein
MASPKGSFDLHQCDINKQIISGNLSASYKISSKDAI